MPTSPQMVSAHMCTDGSTWGWWSLTASLNPAFVYPFDAPQLQVKGCHVGRDGHLQSLRHSWRGSLLVPIQPLQPQEWRLWVWFFQTPEGAAWKWIVHGSMVVHFWVGMGQRIWGNVIWLPSRASTDSLPLILPLLTQSSAAPPSPTAVLPPTTN